MLMLHHVQFFLYRKTIDKGIFLKNKDAMLIETRRQNIRQNETLE